MPAPVARAFQGGSQEAGRRQRLALLAAAMCCVLLLLQSSLGGGDGSGGSGTAGRGFLGALLGQLAGTSLDGDRRPCAMPALIPRDDAWLVEPKHGEAYKSVKHTYRHWDYSTKCKERSELLADVDDSGKLQITGCSAGSASYCLGCKGSVTPPKEAIKYEASNAPDVGSDVTVVQVWCKRKERGGSDGVTWGMNPDYVWITLPRAALKTMQDAKERYPAARGVSALTPATGAKDGKADTRVPNVVVLLLDSVSQRHFARSTPQLNATLEGLERSNMMRTFTFKFNHVVGWNSNENQVPLMGGVHWRTNKNPNKPVEHCSSVWHYFREQGYLTGHAEHTHWFPDSTYFAAQRKFCADNAQGTRKIQGPDLPMPDGYFVDEKWGCARTVEPLTHYVKHLLQRVPSTTGLPYFTTVFIPDNHASFSATYTQTLDKPLAKFYKDGIDHTNTIVFLVADHGLHFGKHLESFEGQLEHKLPLLKVSVPRRVLDAHPGLEKHFEMNHERLVNHYDSHRTLVHLAHMLGPRQQPAPEGDVNDSPFSISYIDEEIPDDRQCSECGIPDSVCMCQAWISASPTEDEAFQVADKVMAYLNNATQVPGAKGACDQAAVFEVLTYEHKPFKRSGNNAGELVKIQFYALPSSLMDMGGTGWLGGSGERKVKGEVAPAAQEGGPPVAAGYPMAQFEAVVYLRATGGYDWHPKLTGDMDFHYAHRLTGMQSWEKTALADTLGKDKTAQEIKNAASFPLEWCVKAKSA